LSITIAIGQLVGINLKKEMAFIWNLVLLCVTEFLYSIQDVDSMFQMEKAGLEIMKHEIAK